MKMSLGSLFNKSINVITVILMVLLLWQKVPLILSQWEQQKTAAPVFQVPLLDGKVFDFASSQQPLVLVFWATWCGPCEVELARLNAMIQEGTLSAQSVLAISSFESLATVKKASEERQYRFPIGWDEDGRVAQKFKVSGTPTIVFIKGDRQIDWITTGLSPLLGVRLKHFLAQH
jgi:peroxiredoxin